MNVKIGDKVRIKTEEELLASGYIKYNNYYENKNNDFVDRNELGKIVMLVEYDNETETEWFRYQEIGTSRFECIPKSAIAEVIPQTLDEYIYNLPLEERAEKFVYKYKEFVYAGFDSYYTRVFASSLTQSSYNTYDEALQATIEALKQPREKNNDN